MLESGKSTTSWESAVSGVTRPLTTLQVLVGMVYCLFIAMDRVGESDVMCPKWSGGISKRISIC